MSNQYFKIAKYVSTSDETEIVEINYSEEIGDLVENPISVSSLEEESNITVISNQNIRTNDEVDAERVEFLNFQLLLI